MAIPNDLKESLERYVQHKCPTGGFLRYVLENNLMAAMGKADEDNRAALFDICGYIWNEIPGNCHGSPEKVQAWLASREAEPCTPTQ